MTYIPVCPQCATNTHVERTRSREHPWLCLNRQCNLAFDGTTHEYLHMGPKRDAYAQAQEARAKAEAAGQTLGPAEPLPTSYHPTKETP